MHGEPHHWKQEARVALPSCDEHVEYNGHKHKNAPALGQGEVESRATCGSRCGASYVLLPKLARNVRDHRNPFLPGTFDGFGDSVVKLGKPIGTVEYQRHSNFLSGGLHGPGIVTAAHRVALFSK